MLQELVDAISKLVRSQINEVHTAIPAEVVEFNPADCTATVKPFGKIVLTNGKEYAYPVINDVPVLFPRGSGQDCVIVYPVRKGDGCLLIMSEQALDCWRSSGTHSSELKYSLSNAVAITGLFARPTNDVSDAVENNCIIIRNGSSSIRITDSKIAIRGDVEVDGNLITKRNETGSLGVINAPTGA